MLNSLNGPQLGFNVEFRHRLCLKMKKVRLCYLIHQLLLKFLIESLRNSIQCICAGIVLPLDSMVRVWNLENFHAPEKK